MVVPVVQRIHDLAHRGPSSATDPVRRVDDFQAGYRVEYVHMVLVGVALPRMCIVITDYLQRRIAAEARSIFVLDRTYLVVLIDDERFPDIYVNAVLTAHPAQKSEPGAGEPLNAQVAVVFYEVL